MKRVEHTGGFWLCLLLNLLLNWQWSIPGWILLGLHLWLQHHFRQGGTYIKIA